MEYTHSDIPSGTQYRNMLHEYKAINRNFVPVLEIVIKTKTGHKYTIRDVVSYNYEHTVNKPAKLTIELANYRRHLEIKPEDMVTLRRGYREISYYPKSERNPYDIENQLATRFVGFVESIKDNTLICYDELHFINIEHIKTPEWVGEAYYPTDEGGKIMLVDKKNPNITFKVPESNLQDHLYRLGGDYAPKIAYAPFDIRDIVNDVAAPRPRRIAHWFNGDKIVDFPFEITFFSEKANGGIAKRVVLRGVMASSYHYGIDPRLPDIFYVRPKYRKKGWALPEKFQKLADITDFNDLDRVYRDYVPEGNELVDIFQDYGNPDEIVIDDRWVLDSSLTKPTNEIIGIQFTYKLPNDDPNKETDVQYLYIPAGAVEGDVVLGQEKVLDKVDRIHEMWNRDLYYKDASSLAIQEFHNQNNKRFSGSLTIKGHPIIFAGDRVWYVDANLIQGDYDPELLIMTVAESFDNNKINQTLTAE